MATCDMGYEHADPIPAEPEPVVIAPDPGPNENDVAIAQIEADASVKREQLYTEQQALELAAENERLRGELAGMRETLALLQPEPEPAPEPVVITPAPAPEPESTPAPPEIMPPAASESKKPGYWDAYR